MIDTIAVCQKDGVTGNGKTRYGVFVYGTCVMHSPNHLSMLALASDITTAVQRYQNWGPVTVHEAKPRKEHE